MKKNKNNHNFKIKYLDGIRLKNAVLASIGLFSKNREYLDRINVFPVPDGDTGTNMYLTMSQISAGIAHLSHRSIATMSSHLAESALMGAQGNSGAILAQFFMGFAEGTGGKWHLSTEAFAAAVQRAIKSARTALKEPKEGTILSVMSDWANHIAGSAPKTEDFVDLLKKGLQIAKQSLADTPKKLAVLKKAGVVDAGAQGFVYFLEGIVNFIEKGKIKKVIELIKNPTAFKTTAPMAALSQIDADIRFRYCTECMIAGQNLDHKKLQQELEGLGDSLIVAGSSSRVRIHVHTNTPDKVFTVAALHGEVDKKKIDDMQEQHNALYQELKAQKIGIITDSACDLPHSLIEGTHIHTIPLKLTFGEETFLDKVQLSPRDFYEKLSTSPHHPRTSQPAMADVKAIIEKIRDRYEHLVAIHVPRISSGTLQVVENAARQFGQDKVTCVDSKGISCALGLVVLEAARAAKEGLSLEQVMARIDRAIKSVHFFVFVPGVKFMIKGGRVSKLKGFIANLLGLKPIVSLSEEGRVYPAAKVLNEKKGIDKIIAMGIDAAKQYKRIEIVVAHAAAFDKAKDLAARLTEVFKPAQDIPIIDAAPVMGAHVGPGTVGYSFLGHHED